MPNWNQIKKMAEAFGRAMSERAKDTPASKAVAESKTVKDLDKIGYLHQATPEQRAYLEGHEHSGPDNYYAAKERGGDYETRIDEIEDENSDARLGRELDAAIKKAEGQADYAGRMKGMREGEIVDDAVDEAVADDYGEQYLEEFKDRLRNGNVADALRWAAEEYEKYK